MGCNCDKRKIGILSKFSEDGEIDTDRSWLRIFIDFILTIIIRIFCAAIIMIMGIIVIPISMVFVLFKGTNDLNFDIVKFLLGRKNNENAKR